MNNKIIFLTIIIFILSLIFGGYLDEHIQKLIIDYPDSYKFYQLIQNVTSTDNIIQIAIFLLWVIGVVWRIIKHIEE